MNKKTKNLNIRKQYKHSSSYYRKVRSYLKNRESNRANAVDKNDRLCSVKFY